MLAQPATLGGFCPASATLTSLVGGLKTMSPAPGRRPLLLTYLFQSMQASVCLPPPRVVLASHQQNAVFYWDYDMW